MVGRQFGYLTVVAFERTENRRTHWSCVCRCGTKHIATRSNLVSGGTTSCGCLKKEQRKYKEATINHEYNQHKNGGMRRGYGFMEKEQWLSVAQLPCAYCGELDIRNKAVSCKNGKGYSRLPEAEIVLWNCTLNGVDRVNNDAGYVFGNCVPCCEKCNRMKMSLGVDDFLNHVRRIYENRKAQ